METFDSIMDTLAGLRPTRAVGSLFQMKVDQQLLYRICCSRLRLLKCPECRGIFAHHFLVMQPMVLALAVATDRAPLPVGIPVGEEVCIASIPSLKDMEEMVAFLNQLPVPADRFDHLVLDATVLHVKGKMRLSRPLWHRLALGCAQAVLAVGSFGARMLKTAIRLIVFLLAMVVRLTHTFYRVYPILANARGGKVVRFHCKVGDAERLKLLLYRRVAGASVHITEAVREATNGGQMMFTIDVVGDKHRLRCRPWSAPATTPDMVVEYRNNWLRIVS